MTRRTHTCEHAYARMERDTQAQQRRGAPPVVSLGEVPGVSLSGLLGPSFRASTKPIESTILPSSFSSSRLSLSRSLPSVRDAFQLHIRRITLQIPRITDFRSKSVIPSFKILHIVVNYYRKLILLTFVHFNYISFPFYRYLTRF